MIKNLEKKVRGYVLKNSIAYGGKANPGFEVNRTTSSPGNRE